MNPGPGTTRPATVPGTIPGALSRATLPGQGKERVYDIRMARPAKVQTLREWRDERGYSLQDMGDKIDMTRSNYAFYENGARVPNVYLAQRIAAALGVRLEQIANWQPDQEPSSTRRRQEVARQEE